MSSALATVKEQEEQSVRVAATDAMKRANGDRAKATSLLAGMVRSQPALRKAILDPLIEYACSGAISRVVMEDRRSVWSHGTKVNTSSMSNADKVKAYAESNLLAFPLPLGGKTLGDATREDISANADFYIRQADDMSHKGRWLQAIAQSLPANKKASQVLSNERLHELQEKTRHA